MRDSLVARRRARPSIGEVGQFGLDPADAAGRAGRPEGSAAAARHLRDLWWTQFYQGLLAGDGNRQWQHGGKGDVLITVDGGKLGLWDGLFVNFHEEMVYGRDANFLGDGSLIPVNTALAFPRPGGGNFNTSLTVTQVFRQGLSVSVGKFNMLDAASKTPLVGGGGLDTFMHLGLAALVSGVTPPCILGGIATLKMSPAIFTLMAGVALNLGRGFSSS